MPIRLQHQLRRELSLSGVPLQGPHASRRRRDSCRWSRRARAAGSRSTPVRGRQRLSAFTTRSVSASHRGPSRRRVESVGVRGEDRFQRRVPAGPDRVVWCHVDDEGRRGLVEVLDQRRPRSGYRTSDADGRGAATGAVAGQEPGRQEAARRGRVRVPVELWLLTPDDHGLARCRIGVDGGGDMPVAIEDCRVAGACLDGEDDRHAEAGDRPCPKSAPGSAGASACRRPAAPAVGRAARCSGAGTGDWQQRRRLLRGAMPTSRRRYATPEGG